MSEARVSLAFDAAWPLVVKAASQAWDLRCDTHLHQLLGGVLASAKPSDLEQVATGFSTGSVAYALIAALGKHFPPTLLAALVETCPGLGSTPKNGTGKPIAPLAFLTSNMANRRGELKGNVAAGSAYESSLKEFLGPEHWEVLVRGLDPALLGNRQEKNFGEQLLLELLKKPALKDITVHQAHSLLSGLESRGIAWKRMPEAWVQVKNAGLLEAAVAAGLDLQQPVASKSLLQAILDRPDRDFSSIIQTSGAAEADEQVSLASYFRAFGSLSEKCAIRSKNKSQLSSRIKLWEHLFSRTDWDQVRDGLGRPAVFLAVLADPWVLRDLLAMANSRDKVSANQARRALEQHDAHGRGLWFYLQARWESSSFTDKLASDLDRVLPRPESIRTGRWLQDCLANLPQVHACWQLAGSRNLTLLAYPHALATKQALARDAGQQDDAWLRDEAAVAACVEGLARAPTLVAGVSSLRQVWEAHPAFALTELYCLLAARPQDFKDETRKPHPVLARALEIAGPVPAFRLPEGALDTLDRVLATAETEQHRQALEQAIDLVRQHSVAANLLQTPVGNAAPRPRL